MKHKTSELTGDLLDAAVAKAMGATIEDRRVVWPDGNAPDIPIWLSDAIGLYTQDETDWTPSTSWAIAGPIIERERIHLTPVDAGGTFLGTKQERDGWLARCTESFMNERGDTPLIAAMRAFVAYKLGEEVEL